MSDTLSYDELSSRYENLQTLLLNTKKQIDDNYSKVAKIISQSSNEKTDDLNAISSEIDFFRNQIQLLFTKAFSIDKVQAIDDKPIINNENKDPNKANILNDMDFRNSKNTYGERRDSLLHTNPKTNWKETDLDAFQKELQNEFQRQNREKLRRMTEDQMDLRLLSERESNEVEISDDEKESNEVKITDDERLAMEDKLQQMTNIKLMCMSERNMTYTPTEVLEEKMLIFPDDRNAAELLLLQENKYELMFKSEAIQYSAIQIKPMHKQLFINLMVDIGIVNDNIQNSIWMEIEKICQKPFLEKVEEEEPMVEKNVDNSLMLKIFGYAIGLCSSSNEISYDY